MGWNAQRGEGMIDETIISIEREINDADKINPDEKRELLELLDKLKDEVGALSSQNAEQAKSITGYAKVSTHEATRSKIDENLLKHSISGLEATVEGFEVTHPKLTEIVNAICVSLSNIGI